MDKNIEKEYKILLTKDQFYDLLQNYAPLHFIEQINIYYDNDSNDIRNLKAAMRIRTKKNKHTFTIKIPSSEGLQEYECPVKENTNDAFINEEITSLLLDYNIHGPFYEIGKLKTSRAKYVTDEAELCFDISEYNGTIDYEIEYEYIKEHDGLFVFNEILRKINMKFEQNCESKIARALKK